MNSVISHQSSVNRPTVEFAVNRFMASAAPVPSRLTAQGKENAFLDLKKKIEYETDYEPPTEYWSALWSKPTDRNRSAAVTLQWQGSVVRVSKKLSAGAERGKVFERDWRHNEQLPPHSSLGNKHAIHEFSASSRRNLTDKLCSLRLDVWTRAQFLTLTYHDEWPEPKAVKAHLRAFYKRVVYYAKIHGHKLADELAMIWRMEIKNRLSGTRKGEPAPHFHLFVFNAPKIPKYMLLQWWREITGDSSITQVDRQFLTTRRKAMNYLSKYVSKADTQGGSADHLDIALYRAKMGRHWGSEGLTDAHFAPIREMTIQPLESGLLKFVALIETAFPFLVDRWSFGFKLFTFDAPADWIWDMFNYCLSPDVVDTVSAES